jgi:hypothetical protein
MECVKMKENASDESGITLIETIIALLILLAGLLSMAQVLAFGVIASKTYGRDATKTTAAAHDKMEELMSLRFSDITTNLAVEPPFTNDGQGLKIGGAIPPAAPADGYSDYLDFSGLRTTADNDPAYARQWKIEKTSDTLKKITVVVTSIKSFQYGTAPSTTIVTEKAP